jgi:hypothetical protein
VIGLPKTNAYHTQLVKYQTQSEVLKVYWKYK